MRPTYQKETCMIFTGLFILVLAALAAAAAGLRRLALALFAVSLSVNLLTFLHHATDVLPLSF